MSQTYEIQLTINGQAVAGERESMEIRNPATQEVLGTAPNASSEQLDSAVKAAREAFDDWRKTGIEERRALVELFADRIEQEQDALSEMLTREQGKPIAQARAEVSRGILWARTLARIPLDSRQINGDDDQAIELRYTPLGVVAGIVPWNFPVTLALWKLSPALVTGNTIILKPSPFTPFTGLRLGEIAREIFPAGVVNILTGDDDLGPLMTAHPDIAKIAFTGSSATGKKVMAAAAASLKRVTLELGGNDAAVVLPDVDVEDIAPQLFWACFANSSQYCLATKRVYIHEDIYDEVRDAMVEYAKTVRLGNGMDETTQMGPIQNQLQYDKVLQYIKESEDEGHTFAYKNTDLPETGLFVGPVIVDNPPENSRIVQEEPFGPIVPLLRFSDDDDVVQRINASPYGLGGSVWGADTDRVMKIAERIESGVVWVNQVHRLHPEFPLGGHKDSGLGRENGIEGLLEYCNTQVIAVKK